MKASVTQSINCSHQLPGTMVHGHTYRVTVRQSGPLRDDGMVCGFDVLTRTLRTVLGRVDHGPLEQVIGKPATAERLAEWIKSQMGGAVVVRVQVGDEGSVETE